MITRSFIFALSSGAWNWAAILAEGYSGRIIILWKSSIGKITPLAIFRASVHLAICSFSHGLVVVYHLQWPKVGATEKSMVRTFGYVLFRPPMAYYG